MVVPATTGKQTAKSNAKPAANTQPAPAEKPAESPAVTTAPPATNGEVKSEVLRGTVRRDGVLPPVSNRGRKPNPVPEETAADLLDILQNGGTIDVEGTISQVGKYKRDVTKWINEKKKAHDWRIEPTYRSDPERGPKPTADEKGLVVLALTWHNRPRNTSSETPAEPQSANA